MPRLWTETIEAHRLQVRDAILQTTAALVAQHGLLSVTMSRIAEETGIGRATLYKYFPDLEEILLAWHEHQIDGHLERLAEIRDRTEGAGRRLEAVLEEYALIRRERVLHHEDEPRRSELVAFLHGGASTHDDDHGGHRHVVARAQQRVLDMLRDLLIAAAESGDVRDDIPPDELAVYCFHALDASEGLRSKAAVRRLVSVTLAGMRPAHG